MTDAEIVKVLAERFDGIENPQPYEAGGFWGHHTKSGQIGLCSNYLSDRNSLARVIGKMTEEERERFNAEMMRARKENANQEWFDVFALTCDPRVIAGCVARAIQKGKA